MKILSSTNILLLAIGMTVLLFVLDFVFYGSGISGDTPEYLSLAGDVYNLKFPHSPLYLPGFPMLIGFTAKLISIKMYQAAQIWMGLFYGINIVYLYKLVNYLHKIKATSKLGSYFLFFVMISWWSFRIQKATHADAMYFSLLIVLTVFTMKSFLENKANYFFGVGIVLAIMAITKYNAFILISIIGLLIVLADFEFKLKIKYILISILPSVGSIMIWKFLNGGFIYALNASNYEKSSFSFLDVLNSMVTNTTNFGKTVVELLINPIVGRYINSISGLIIGTIVILFFIFLVFKYRKSKLEFIFITFAFIYLISVIFIQSINLVSEINIRTLLTFNFFMFLLIGLKIQSYKNKIAAVSFFCILLLNNFLISYKWITQTSKGNSFKYEYATQNEVFFKDNLFLKSIKNKEVMSNVSEQLLFHINYQQHVQTFKTDRLFYKGKFEELKDDDLKKITKDLKTCIEKEGVIVFSNSESSNDKLILKELSTNKYCFNTINNLIIISKSKLDL